jgi:hypothetical protein
MELESSLPYSEEPIIATQMNPVHYLKSYILKIHINVILPFMPRSLT